MLLYDSVWCWFHWDIHWLIFRVKFLKKEVDIVMCALGSSGGFAFGDSHIALFPKRPWNVKPSCPWENTQKLLSDDPHIVLLPKKAIDCDTIIAMGKYSKIALRWSPYCTITKNGNRMWCHHCHGKVLKNCFPMIPISYITKNGNSANWACHFGKYLLTVGGDEQQETAILPLILNISVALFWEHIPYMYMYVYAPIHYVRM